MFRLRSLILTLFLLGVVFTNILGGWGIYHVNIKSFLEHEEHHMRLTLFSARDQLEHAFLDNHQSEINSILAPLAAQREIDSYYLVDKNWQIVHASSLAEIGQALPETLIAYRTWDDTPQIQPTEPTMWRMPLNRRIGGQLIVNIDVSYEVAQRQHDSMMTIAWFSLVYLMVAALLFYLLSKFVIKPIRRISHKAELLGQGEFSLSSQHLQIWELDHLDRVLNEAGQNLNSLTAESRLLAHAFETQEGIIIADAKRNILRVNKSFTRITGYSEGEVRGKNPRMLQSGKQDKKFYYQMWKSLHDNDVWQGETWNKHKDGSLFPIYQNISVVRDERGEVQYYLGMFVDISKQIQAEEQIQYQQQFDVLTGLYNSTKFSNELNEQIVSTINSSRFGAVLYIDIDRFKYINDAFGFKVGDSLIVKVAQRLEQLISQEDVLARIGTDEFAIICHPIAASLQGVKEYYSALAERIMQSVREAITIQDMPIYIGLSIGVAGFGNRQQSAEEVLLQAETAMYEAKKHGRGQVLPYQRDSFADTGVLINTQAELYQALHNHQLKLFYQPQYNEQHQLVGAEALIRWPHATKGMVSPIEFIPIAEESGLIIPLGDEIINMATTAMATWLKKYQLPKGFRLAINISARQFEQAEFVPNLRSQLAKHHLSARYFELEITESSLASNMDDVVKKLKLLRSVGFNISIDDFGTGYSSLSYLKRLPINKLKIDQSFVRDLPDNPSDVRIANAMQIA